MLLKKDVWIPTDPSNSYHLWAPEIHRINNKWYIYFAADDGNMDNHQIYVVENEAANPMEGTFVTKGRIQTDKRQQLGQSMPAPLNMMANAI